MWTRLIISISVIEAGIMSLLQTEAVPASWVDALTQYPPLIAVIIVAYYMHKMQKEENRVNREWLEHMLKTERENTKNIYERQDRFVSELLTQIETKQNKMADRIELLTQQIAVNTSTVNEIAKVDDIVGSLIEKLDKK